MLSLSLSGLDKWTDECLQGHIDGWKEGVLLKWMDRKKYQDFISQSNRNTKRCRLSLEKENSNFIVLSIKDIYVTTDCMCKNVVRANCVLLVTK